MKRLHNTIAHALNELSERADMALGSKKKTTEPLNIEGWREQLLERLVREADVHKWMLLGILLACLLLFVSGLFLLFYHRDNPSAYQLIFGGGSLVSMVAVLNMARLTLIDKVRYNVLIGAVAALPADNVVVLIKSFFNTSLAKK